MMTREFRSGKTGRLQLLLVLLAGLSLVLNACGGSEQASAEQAPAEPPDPPAALTAAADDGEVELSWLAPDDAEVSHYGIHWGTDRNGLTENAQAAAAALTHLVTGLANGTEYFFAVSTIDVNGKTSDLSDIVSATPVGTDSPPPVEVETCVFGESKFGACTLAP